MRVLLRVLAACIILTGLVVFRECLVTLVAEEQDLLQHVIWGDEAEVIEGEATVADTFVASLAVDQSGPDDVAVIEDSPEAEEEEEEDPVVALLGAISASLGGDPPVRSGVVPGDKVVVVGKLQTEDTDWIAKYLPDWQNAIYTVNNVTAERHTTLNKGREANAYLTYIIENYDNLPSTVAFIHSHHKSWPAAWHTDAPGYNNVRSLSMLQIEHIQRAGYASLRCQLEPGCPGEIQPFRTPADPAHSTEHAFAQAYRALFNTTDVPSIVAAPCCAQFAVSRTQILQRSREEYAWYHKWLMETRLGDDISGRIFEYLWHVIFGQEAVYCPAAEQCYLDVYGRNVSA